jgi:mannose-6-phosphate isomerase-like protein (cupin superfamily)
MTKQYSMPIVDYTPAQMEKRVARFQALKYPPNRYHDSQLPGNARKNYLVVGTGLLAEGSNDPWSAIPIKEGFQMSYIKAVPGNGPVLHNHDTNETFVCLEGQWKVIWGLHAEHSVLLDKYDVCSVPPYVPRRFECVQAEPGKEEGLLQSIQPGNEPRVEWI